MEGLTFGRDVLTRIGGSPYLRGPMKITIHGHGSLSAAGATSAAAHAACVAGKQCWSVDEETGLPVYRIGELPAHAAIETFADKHQPDRATLLALHAADRAVSGAGWAGRDFAILVGCSRGPTGSWEEAFGHYAESGEARLRTSPRTTLGSLGFALADYFGVRSLSDGLSVTCSSGMHAILHGIALLRSGMVERVLVGGTEAPLTTFTLRQMEALRIYARVPDDGRPACRPLANPPSGMVVGEGAAFFALSLAPDDDKPGIHALTFARERQASLTGISPEGEGLQRTMREAVALAGRPDFVVAHAPGTPRGDTAERAALAAVFGDHQPAIRSFKWATGHTFGASGPLGICAALSAMRAGELPYSPYLETEAEQQPEQFHRALVNATGFGGNVISVVVGLAR